MSDLDFLHISKFTCTEWGWEGWRIFYAYMFYDITEMARYI